VPAVSQTTTNTSDGGRTEAAAGVATAAPRKESAARRRPRTFQWIERPASLPDGSLAGLLEVVHDGEQAEYRVRLADGDEAHEVWAVAKKRGDETFAEEYFVSLPCGGHADGRPTCTCRAAFYRGECRHCAFLPHALRWLAGH
jgi:hypothetical protein